MVEVVAALIWDNGKFMICQRPKHKTRALEWEFVGGKVEPNESKEDALIRECREELDITVEVGEVFMEVIHQYPDILVHLTLSDGEEIETTMFHPFFVQDEACNGSGRWSAASNLVSGDVLLMEDGKSVYVLEVRIEKLDEEINVYNLEVDEWHTYFVAGGVLVHNTYDTNGTSVDSVSGSNTNTPLSLQQALEELDASGLRPGQTELHMSQLNSALDGIQNNYNPTKAYSSVYSDGTNRYLVEGHHTTVAFKMLGKDNAINMNTATSDLPSVTNVYWTKKWYQFWRKTIKIVED